MLMELPLEISLCTSQYKRQNGHKAAHGLSQYCSNTHIFLMKICLPESWRQKWAGQIQKQTNPTKARNFHLLNELFLKRVARAPSYMYLHWLLPGRQQQNAQVPKITFLLACFLQVPLQSQQYARMH